VTKIQIRRGTATQWTYSNPVLGQGEFGYEVDTYKLKIGDGSTAWSGLPYIPLDWSTLPNKPAYIAAGSTALAARTAIDLGNVDNTSDATKNSAVAQLTNKDLTSATNTFPSSLVTLTGTQALSNKTLTAPTVTGYTESVNALGTVSSSATLSLSSGTVITATLTASTACTFTMPTPAAGQSFVLFLKQPASTGGGSATFTNVKWSVLGTPTITTAAGKMDILSFFSDGTNWYGSASQGYTY